jgi:Uma2 family endonuclease
MASSLDMSWSARPIVLSGGGLFRDLSGDQMFEFCQANSAYRIERTAEGDLVIEAPAGFNASNRNSLVGAQLVVWAAKDGTGKATDSSGGFILPNGALRSPDAAWTKRERVKLVPEDQRKKFPSLAPDFVIELRSESDRLSHQRASCCLLGRRPSTTPAKMKEWIDNGVRLAWLIDPSEKRVEIYRPGKTPERLDAPAQISGDPELPGFVLDLTPIWQLD